MILTTVTYLLIKLRVSRATVVGLYAMFKNGAEFAGCYYTHILIYRMFATSQDKIK